MQIIKKLIVYILTLESRLILAKYKPFIVAVTGSVGQGTLEPEGETWGMKKLDPRPKPAIARKYPPANAR